MGTRKTFEKAPRPCQCWIEVTNRWNGTMRLLPVRYFIVTPIIDGIPDLSKPPREELQIEDVDRIWFGETAYEAVSQLRTRYPIGPYQWKLQFAPTLKLSEGGPDV